MHGEYNRSGFVGDAAGKCYIRCGCRVHVRQTEFIFLWQVRDTSTYVCMYYIQNAFSVNFNYSDLCQIKLLPKLVNVLSTYAAKPIILLNAESQR